MDRSSFCHNGTGIPSEIKQFWNIEHMQRGERKTIVLKHIENCFDAEISMDNQPNPRARLIWSRQLADCIEYYLSEWYDYFYNNKDSLESAPIMRLEKMNHSLYKVEFIDLLKHIKDHKQCNEAVSKSPCDIDFANRIKAIEYHGLSCSVCGFSFEKVYGRAGKGFIEVHQVLKLENAEDNGIDYANNIFTVCSNCHQMIHRNEFNERSVEKIRRLLLNDKKDEWEK